MVFSSCFLTLILTLYSLKNSGTMDANRYRITLIFDKSGHFNVKKVIMDFASRIQILPPQPHWYTGYDTIACVLFRVSGRRESDWNKADHGTDIRLPLGGSRTYRFSVPSSFCSVEMPDKL